MSSTLTSPLWGNSEVVFGLGGTKKRSAKVRVGYVSPKFECQIHLSCINSWWLKIITKIQIKIREHNWNENATWTSIESKISGHHIPLDLTGDKAMIPSQNDRVGFSVAVAKMSRHGWTLNDAWCLCVRFVWNLPLKPCLPLGSRLNKPSHFPF